ncbi:hypothetical protein VSS37_03450 [Candidatus Thiothrix sp. Deng01]|uniref:Tail protein n=1 Tax=Candidatus Thiothrix phosphatis TaxID=3112415 RepID=A0ABU6CT69_9GAMM|nr:hypothetical protein [Candidatus Thiothrix sp. Deng01]MEB4590026.1 hypothetical protein [Candidatus Thiothrix sp. Deng01]
MAILKLSEKNKVLHFQKETTEGTAIAQTVSSVLLTKGLSAEIGNGDSQVDEYDGVSSRDAPVSSGNLRNAFSFDLPVTLSGTAGTAPAFGGLLQACGFKETVTAGSKVAYTPEALASIKSGSVLMRRDTGTGYDLWYETKGAKGVLGLEVKAGQRPTFKVKLTGDYLEPRRYQNTSVAATNYGTQKTYVCDTATPSSVVLAKLNGNDLCLDSLSIPNLSGLDLQYYASMCSGFTVANPATPEATITGVMPDWQGTGAWNPYQYARTDGAVKRFVFEMVIGSVAGRIIRLVCDEVQPVSAKDASLNGGVLGYEMGLRFLSPITIEFS